MAVFVLNYFDNPPISINFEQSACVFNKECITYIFYMLYSTFDGNVAPSGAAINLGYYDARLDNVSLNNQLGSAIRVRIRSLTSLCLTILMR